MSKSARDVKQGSLYTSGAPTAGTSVIVGFFVVTGLMLCLGLIMAKRKVMSYV